MGFPRGLDEPLELDVHANIYHRSGIPARLLHARNPANTVCVPESTTANTGNTIDSVGDRFMPRMSYRNFDSYESFLVSHTVQVGTRYRTSRPEFAGTSCVPTAAARLRFTRMETSAPTQSLYRFMPSIAEDANGNAAVGYNVSSSSTHPGINASYFSLTSPGSPTEITLYDGAGDEENTWHMGDYSSMTVDPEDGCTFWYVNQYFPTNQTGSAQRMGNADLKLRGSRMRQCHVLPGQPDLRRDKRRGWQAPRKTSHSPTARV